MTIFLVSLFISLNYIAALFYLPFVVPYFDESGVRLLFVFLNIIGYFVMYLPCIAFNYCTKKFTKLNADTTLALSKQKLNVKSLDDIIIEKCTQGLWKFYVGDNTYAINLKGYIFQLSFIMAIMVRLVYYRYIKNGLQKHFALHARVPIRSLKIHIKTPRNRIITKKLVRHYHLWHGLFTQAICYYQITKYFYIPTPRNLGGFFAYKPDNLKVKYTEEWWLQGGRLC